MNDRVASATRTAAAGLSAFAAGGFDLVRNWIYGGDVTAMVILGVVAVIMLLVVVVPSGRRY